MPKVQGKIAKSRKPSKKTTSLPVRSLLSKFNLIAILAVVFLMTALIVYAKNQLANSPFLSIQTPIALPTFTPIPKTPTPTADPNPIITCNINASCGGGSRQLRQSVCDSMNCCLIDQRCGGPKFITKTACNNSFCCLLNDDTGKLLSSKSACDNYYPNNTTINLPSTGNTYTPPTYYTCTLYYSALKLYQTYTSLYKTKAECDAAQTSLNQGSQTFQIQPAPVDNTANNQHCKAAASQTLSEKEQGVEAQYGGTNGIAAFTIQNVLIPEYNQAVANCDQLYPI
jgi:hypothetical protein